MKANLLASLFCTVVWYAPRPSITEIERNYKQDLAYSAGMCRFAF